MQNKFPETKFNCEFNLIINYEGFVYRIHLKCDVRPYVAIRNSLCGWGVLQVWLGSGVWVWGVQHWVVGSGSR